MRDFLHDLQALCDRHSVKLGAGLEFDGKNRVCAVMRAVRIDGGSWVDGAEVPPISPRSQPDLKKRERPKFGGVGA